MNNLEFRAWDTVEKKWYTPTYEAHKGDLHDLFISLSGRLSAHTVSGMEDESLWPDRYIISQYTGTKDQKGQKIYAEDIVQCEHGWLGIVRYFTSHAHFGCEEIVTRKINSHGPMFVSWNELDIIGNIHQNPDLLNG